jgi:uncharacterized repeat protein (TIGR01451 family)
MDKTYCSIPPSTFSIANSTRFMNMKRLHKVIGLAAIALVTVPLLSATPVWAQLQQVGQTAVETLQQKPQVQLQLSAEQKFVEKDEKGQSVTNWQPLSQASVVHPGDVLRYSVAGQNLSDRPIENLVVNQMIPAQMKYVLNSAVQPAGIAAIYSIDNGKTFVANPTVQVRLTDGTVETRSAPAEVYTHIRWDINAATKAGASTNVSYQLEVR